MKHTILLTQHCNLACQYCYIGKKKSRMSPGVAKKVVDFIFKTTPLEESIDVGFFGGEPLLEFKLLRMVTELMEDHPDFDRNRVHLTTVTNGTIFTSAIAQYFSDHDIALGISCDGPPDMQDHFRRYANGRGTSKIVEATIRRACDTLSGVMVNAVYHPSTLSHLPRAVEYFSGLGIRHIYLNPDFSADWTPDEIALLPEAYQQISDQYVRHYLNDDPHFISLIDNKITVILRDGYQPLERCRMGQGEFAFTPTGDIYPCERLVGNGDSVHCIGNVDNGARKPLPPCLIADGDPLNAECLSCSLKECCMNWCGCTNHFSTGYYNRVSPFLCASEKAAIAVSLDALQKLEGTTSGLFFDHFAGRPLSNSCR